MPQQRSVQEILNAVFDSTNNVLSVTGDGWTGSGTTLTLDADFNNVNPDANDGAALGTSGTAWSDLFLASGAVINFAAGNVTWTHSTGFVTSNVDFRVTTAGTNAASVVTVGGTQTLTSKTLTSPTIGTSPTAAGATWTDLGAVTTLDINGGTVDGVTIGGASAGAITGTTIDATTDFTIGGTVITDGVITDTGNLVINATGLLPDADDAFALGASGTAFSDLFLADGSVINFNAGDITLTHSLNTLTFAGMSSFNIGGAGLQNVGSLEISLIDIGDGTFNSGNTLEVAATANQNVVRFQAENVGQSDNVVYINASGASGSSVSLLKMDASDGEHFTFRGDGYFAPSNINNGDPTALANRAGIFAKDVTASAECHAFDEGGTATQISPHDPITGEYIFNSHNVYTGRKVLILMEKLVREVERLSGKQFMVEDFLPESEKQDWTANQKLAKEEHERDEERKEKEAVEKGKSYTKKVFKPKQPLKFLKDAGVKLDLAKL